MNGMQQWAAHAKIAALIRKLDETMSSERRAQLVGELGDEEAKLRRLKQGAAS
ncbi:MAG TPA: hypothetical protein VGL58_14430 [Caulobacteraceae bacterium]|jgi:phage I-like protein